MFLNVARIRELRERKGLTQAQAAELAEMGTKQAWNNLEKGRVANLTLERLHKIAEALGAKARDLLN